MPDARPNHHVLRIPAARQIATGGPGEDDRTSAIGGTVTMREFFKPWRRKAGVLTLVMACVFMAGWIRSVIHHDGINLPDVLGCRCNLNLSDGVLELRSFQPRDRQVKYAPYSIFRSRGSPFGIGYWHVDIPPSGTVRIWEISYWLAVAPLTLLSAYLLLSKPRPAKNAFPATDLNLPHAEIGIESGRHRR